MPIPSFTASINPFPGYPLTTPVARVAADLTQWPGIMPNYVVVVDDQQRPLGAVAIAVLWAKYPSVPLVQTARSSLRSGDRTLGDYQPWLAAVVTIPMADAVATGLDWLPMTGADPQACWVGVSATGQYQGLLNPGMVLAKLMAEGLPRRDSGSSLRLRSAASAAIPATAQPWVMGLSHTLKTPLTSLLGLSTLLLDHRVGSLNERQTRYALLMRRAIRQLIRLVNQWVDWVRLETDQLELNPSPVDLGPLAESLVPSFLTSWQADAASPPAWASSFAIAISSDVTTVWADRLRLQQSLHGVLDYMLQQGAEPQRLRLEPWGSWLGLTLEASPAEGSPPSPSLSGLQDPGTLDQLGLTLARALCQRQGGALVGRWSPQSGYHLTLLLPLQAEPNDSALPLRVDPFAAAPTRADSFGADPWKTASFEEDPSKTHFGEVEPSRPDSFGANPLNGDPRKTDEAPSPATPPSTTLLLLISCREALIAQVYDHLDGSRYRLVVASTWEDAYHLSQRLRPQVMLWDGPGLPEPPHRASELVAVLDPALPLIVLGPPAMVNLAAAKRVDVAAVERLEFELDRLTGASPPPTPLTLLLWRGHSQGAMGLTDRWQQELQRHHCRLLQAHELTHAGLLCRVWQPQAIIIDSTLPLMAQHWQALAQHPEFLDRPLVALTAPVACPDQLQLQMQLIEASQVLSQPVVSGVMALIQTIQVARR